MGNAIFLIGDKEANSQIAEYVSTIGYDALNIKNCDEMYEAISQIVPDLIIIGNLAELPNLQLASKLKEKSETAFIPLLMVVEYGDKKTRLEAIEAGVIDFLYLPLDFQELKLKLHNYSKIMEHKNNIFAENIRLKREITIKSSEIKANIMNIKEAYAEVIMKLSSAAEYKDPETGKHINRVSYYCSELAEAMGMDAMFREQIFFAAPMHDIGKIGIPDHVLLKNGPLDAHEWKVMKLHSKIGYEILSNPKDSTLAMAQDIALYHHEKFDGSGYPNGVVGDKIPLPARFMAIADVYDALRSDRPYKRGFSHDDSVKIILKGDERLRPSHFDLAILDIFEHKSNVFEEIYEGVGLDGEGNL